MSELAEAGAADDPAFAAVVRQAAADDPATLDALIRAVAAVPGLTEPAIAAALEAAAAFAELGRPGGRPLVSAVLRAPGDPVRALRRWRARGPGAGLPKPVKRGIADAVARLYTVDTLAACGSRREREALVGLLTAVHPKPENRAQSDAFRAVLTGAARAATVAQTIGGVHGRRATAAEWAAAVPGMSVRQLLRHLPDFDRAGLPEPAAELVAARLAEPPAEVSPLLVYRRYRQVRSRRWDGALSAAFGAAARSLPRWPGRTLVLVDLYSGDLWRRRPRRHPAGDLPHQSALGATPGPLAVALGGALRLAGSTVDVVGADGRTFAAEDPRGVLEGAGRFAGFRPGWARVAWGRRRYSSYDRVLLVRLGDGWGPPRDEPRIPGSVPLYRFTYRHERGGPRFHVGGRHLELWGLTEYTPWLVPRWEEAVALMS